MKKLVDVIILHDIHIYVRSREGVPPGQESGQAGDSCMRPAGGRGGGIPGRLQIPI